jgi:hypothetical protein
MSEIFRPDVKIVGSREAVDKESNIYEAATFQVLPHEVPKNIMDEIAKIAGDGKARVTVSTDFGIKEFGTGTSAMCSVSLTCNQDETSIDKAIGIAGDLARGYAMEQRAAAEASFVALLAQRGTGPNYK